jgi:hypothetical protein
MIADRTRTIRSEIAGQPQLRLIVPYSSYVTRARTWTGAFQAATFCTPPQLIVVSIAIDGACLSACTLAIALLPRGQVCATPKAVLGFHAAWRRTPNGGRVTSPLATQVMYEAYPANVRKWIARHGGLSERLILLKGRELAAVVPACDAGPATRTHPTMRPIRS